LDRKYRGLLREVNIINLYRKFIEKSITGRETPHAARLQSGSRLAAGAARIDYFLFFSAIALAALFLIMNVRFSGNTGPAVLILSQRCEDLLGKQLAGMLIMEYNEQNPELSANLQIKISGEKADLLFFDENEFQDLVRNNALVSPGLVIQSEKFDSSVLAIPLVSYMDMLFYNIDLLEAAGFVRPPKTRAEFLAWGKAATGGIAAGAALGLSSNDNLSLSRDIYSWIWAAGGGFWQNPDRAIFNSAIAVGVLSFLGELYQEGILAPQSFNKTGEDRLEEFAQGKIAMMIASTRAIPLLREKMGNNAFGVTAIPGLTDSGKSSLGLSYIYCGISQDCTDPEKARDFLEFLVGKNPVISAGLEAAPGIVPGSIGEALTIGSGLFPGEYLTRDPHFSKALDIFESSEIVHGFSGIPQAYEFENIVREELEAFFEQKQNAADTAASIQSRWDLINFRN